MSNPNHTPRPDSWELLGRALALSTRMVEAGLWSAEAGLDFTLAIIRQGSKKAKYTLQLMEGLMRDD